MRLFLTSLFMILSFNVMASCADSDDQVSYRMCKFKTLEKLEEEVKAKQELLRTKIKEWDEHPDFRNKASELFEQAVKSFQSYLEKQCKFEWSAAAGGNGASSMLASCKTNFYKQYLSSLELQISRFESDY